MKSGCDSKGRDLRNRRVWKCKHCNETQFAEANSKNKEIHLRQHGISKTGNKVPRQPMVQHTKVITEEATQPTPIRQAEAYIDLTTVVKMKPFRDALIAFVVICQLSFSLVINEIFVEFLRTLYPKIEQLLPFAANTIRGWVMEAFKARKAKLKECIARCKSKVHFSFDLWTSPNHLALLGVLAHYIDEYGQNQTVRFNPSLKFLVINREVTKFTSIFLTCHVSNSEISYVF